jgi:hypothetical protein
MPDWGLFGQPEPDFAFDQRVVWNPQFSEREDTAQPALCFTRPLCLSMTLQPSSLRPYAPS